MERYEATAADEGIKAGSRAECIAWLRQLRIRSDYEVFAGAERWVDESFLHKTSVGHGILQLVSQLDDYSTLPADAQELPPWGLEEFRTRAANTICDPYAAPEELTAAYYLLVAVQRYRRLSGYFDRQARQAS
jgi:hypothetical protein